MHQSRLGPYYFWVGAATHEAQPFEGDAQVQQKKNRRVPAGEVQVSVGGVNLQQCSQLTVNACFCRSPTACPKNHIKHTTNRETQSDEAKIHLEHHKNRSRQGVLVLDVANSMVQVWALLESASAHLDPERKGIFFPLASKSDCYSESYMSIIISNQLSNCGHRVCNNDCRHLFATMFTKYLGNATFTNEDLSIQYLRDTAAVMTGSSPDSWNKTYDANARVNGFKRVLSHYPTFKEFVKKDFDVVAATVSRNPITGQVG